MMSERRGWAIGLAIAVGAAVWSSPQVGAADGPDFDRSDFVRPVASWGACAADPPEYYGFPLVTTKNVPGTGLARGLGAITFSSSPFGVTLAPDGSYVFDLHLTFEGLREADSGAYTVWVTSTDLSKIERLGLLGGSGTFVGQVRWNKFLVVLTLEASAEAVPASGPVPSRWQGPIVMRGMSRSGAMHTMAGHGPLQQENCAAYGYGE